MAKKVSTNEHHSTTRERVMAPSNGGWVNPNSRKARRKAERKAATAAKKQRIRERIAANKRLVRA
jgi:hypothetical protein